MLKDVPNEHEYKISRCDIHLVYLERGLFVQLVTRPEPLEVISTSETIDGIIVGQLTASEEKPLDKIIYTGLSVGIARQTMTSAGSVAELP